MYYLHSFLKNNAEKYGIKNTNELEEEYNTFVYNNKDSIEKTFYEENDFCTTVRGLKIRGTYDTRREADVRAKVLQRKDPNFHVFVGQVGYWLPWDPEADDIEDQQYQSSELNKLVKKYNENKSKRDQFFEQNKKENIEQMTKKDEDDSESQTDDVSSKKDESIFSSEGLMEADDPWVKQKLTSDKFVDIDKK